MCEKDGGVEGRASENNFPTLAHILKGRTNRHNAYTFYCDYFLQCVVGRRRWKKGVDKTEVREIATVTDEAFGLLLLENSWAKWVDMAKRNSGTSTVNSRFTNGGVGKNSRKFQGWDDPGLTRFNELMKQVKAERNSTTGEDFDEGFLDFRKMRMTEEMRGKNKNRKESAVDVKKKVMCYNDLGNTSEVEKAMEEAEKREELTRRKEATRKIREANVNQSGLGLSRIEGWEEASDSRNDYGRRGSHEDDNEWGRGERGNDQRGDESGRGDEEEENCNSNNKTQGRMGQNTDERGRRKRGNDQCDDDTGGDEEITYRSKKPRSRMSLNTEDDEEDGTGAYESDEEEDDGQEEEGALDNENDDDDDDDEENELSVGNEYDVIEEEDDGSRYAEDEGHFGFGR